MKSYAAIDAIEGKYTVLELELHDVNESQNISFRDKETEIVDFLTDAITNRVGEIQEGEILVVEREDCTITEIYGKDQEEKNRRIEILKSIMNS